MGAQNICKINGKNPDDGVISKPLPRSGIVWLISIELLMGMIVFLFLYGYIYLSARWESLIVDGFVIFFMILIFKKNFNNSRQIIINKNGVSIIRTFKDISIKFSNIENIAPQIQLSGSSWSFPKYAGISIRKKNEKDIFINTTKQEAEKIFSYYLKNGQNALEQEKIRIPNELDRFYKRIKLNNKIRDLIMVTIIMISSITAFFVLSDYNLRGEYFSWPMKVGFGFVVGFIIVIFLEILYGMKFVQGYEQEIRAFKWRIKILNNILTQSDHEGYTIGPSKINRVENITFAALGTTGILMMIMSFFISLVIIFAMALGNMSSSVFIIFFMNPISFLIGYQFYKKSKVINNQ
jgi:hypothetical protein